MIELGTIRDLVAIASFIIALSYYVLNIRNQRETRQTQLFMQLYDTYSSHEFRKRHSAMINLQYINYEDFMEKYGSENNPEEWTSWLSIGAFFNGIGVLVKRGKIDIALVEELLANAVFIAWVRMKPIIMGWRTRDHEYKGVGRSTKYPFLHGFEYLYTELKKRDTRGLPTNR
jgi:hypothetical protein